MHLHLCTLEQHQRVGERVRVMGERAGVAHDRSAPAARVVNRVDEHALVIRLHVLQLVAELRRGPRASATRSSSVVVP